jgi:hypothetical protein
LFEYFGIGWSLLLFLFPTAKQLTVENYYGQFVSRDDSHEVLHLETIVMFATGGVMIVSEWHRALGEVLACSEGPLAASSVGGTLGENDGGQNVCPLPAQRGGTH